MTNQQLFDDIKILVMTTIGQTEERLGQRIDKLEHRMGSLEKKVGSLEQTIDDGFLGIGESINELSRIIDADKAETDKRLDEHDRQIKQLQAQAA